MGRRFVGVAVWCAFILGLAVSDVGEPKPSRQGEKYDWWLVLAVAGTMVVPCVAAYFAGRLDERAV